MTDAQTAPRKRPFRRLAVIGNHLPRRCGIATFTTDVCDSLERAAPDLECLVVAMNDRPEGYAYPPRVRATILADEIADYNRAADFLNVNEIDAVLVQHEFGIFGGEAGENLLALLAELRAPVVTTLHTVLREPAPAYRRVTERLVELSDAVICLSETGRRFLLEVYDAPPERVHMVHHGVPDVPFVDPNYYKDSFDVEGRVVLLTFGLLSRNKGIEYAIRALSRLVPDHPELVYLVVGQTHPHVKEHEGERYRIGLEHLARDLGVADHVVFHDRFVALEELIRFMGAADIYLTPYLTREQIVSGTLAYTVGAGKAVISTPYYYAEELLSEGRGLLVPFRDDAALADAIRRLVEDETERHRIRKRAYEFGRRMIWPAVAEATLDVIERTLSSPVRRRRPSLLLKPVSHQSRGTLPQVRLTHLRRMSDGTGLLQHALFDVPNPHHGYTTDDNARALILAVELERLGIEPGLARDLQRRYLAFLLYAFDRERGKFHNFLSYDRRWLDATGSEDCQGRALWALGHTVASKVDPGVKAAAHRLLEEAWPLLGSLGSLRGRAFALLGLCRRLDAVPGDHRALEHVRRHAAALLESWRAHCDPASRWYWFEERATYANARIPHALLCAARKLEDDRMLEAALRSLRWLAEVQTGEDGWFSPIGNDGFYPKGGEKARFDQQPIEAEAHVLACLEAWRATGDEWWAREARRAFEWFLGRNDVGLPLFEPATGACHDGLHADRVNGNCGAESTLAYLGALVATKSARAERREAAASPSARRGRLDDEDEEREFEARG